MNRFVVSILLIPHRRYQNTGALTYAIWLLCESGQTFTQTEADFVEYVVAGTGQCF
jgi:hypothetical protein